jgi:hypothetical protein
MSLSTIQKILRVAQKFLCRIYVAGGNEKYLGPPVKFPSFLSDLSTFGVSRQVFITVPGINSDRKAFSADYRTKSKINLSTTGHESHRM